MILTVAEIADLCRFTDAHNMTGGDAESEVAVDLAPHDGVAGTRTYANILEEAGINRTRRRLYMGHTTRDVLDLYEDHDVRKYLTEDGELLREFMGAPIMWRVA